MKNYYRILKIDVKAKLKEIKKAYRNLSFQLHPDVNSSESASDEFSEVSEAYYVLKDAVRRRKYDFLLAKSVSDRKAPNWEQKVNRAADMGRKRGYEYAEKPIEKLKKKYSFEWDFWGVLLEFVVNLLFA